MPASFTRSYPAHAKIDSDAVAVIGPNKHPLSREQMYLRDEMTWESSKITAKSPSLPGVPADDRNIAYCWLKGCNLTTD